MGIGSISTRIRSRQDVDDRQCIGARGAPGGVADKAHVMEQLQGSWRRGDLRSPQATRSLKWKVIGMADEFRRQA